MVQELLKYATILVYYKFNQIKTQNSQGDFDEILELLKSS
jgi:hypothetical protein